MRIADISARSVHVKSELPARSRAAKYIGVPLIVAAVSMTLGGCATHAQIDVPAVQKVYSQRFDNKAFGYEILYSQPEPGVFSGGTQMPLAPLDKAALSVASATTLKRLPEYIFEQLPANVKRASTPGEADYVLHVELVAHHKKGPAYADYQTAKTTAMKMISLGLASANYSIVADFDAKYTLLKQNQVIVEKTYAVKDDVDHQRGDFENQNSLNDYTAQMLQKHLITTLNDFFKLAVAAQ